jgi:small conductance mechanosensitive channel
MNRLLRPVYIIILIALGGVSMPLFAETVSDQAQTTADPEIPIDELDIKLRPLKRDSIKVEIDAWVKLLEDKASEISRADIAVKYKKSEIASAGKLDDALVQLDTAKKNAEIPSPDAEAGLSVEEAERAVEEAKKEAAATVKKVESDTAIQETISLAAKMAKEREMAEAAAETTDQEPDTGNGKADDQPKEAIDKAREKIDAAVEERNRDRSNLLQYLTELRAQQTALIDRLNTVIAAYQKKGGPEEEIKEYQQYVAAVSGIAVDVSDWEATIKTIGGWLLSD